MRPFSGDGCGCTNNCFDIDSPSSNVRSRLTLIWHDNISMILLFISDALELVPCRQESTMEYGK